MWGAEPALKAQFLKKKRQVDEEMYQRNRNLAHSLERQIVENPYDKSNKFDEYPKQVIKQSPEHKRNHDIAIVDHLKELDSMTDSDTELRNIEE